MCGHRERHGDAGCCVPVSCGCGCGDDLQRHFATREERTGRLEHYLQDLRAEAKAVEEHLAEMKAAE